MKWRLLFAIAYGIGKDSGLEGCTCWCGIVLYKQARAEELPRVGGQPLITGEQVAEGRARTSGPSARHTWRRRAEHRQCIALEALQKQHSFHAAVAP